MQDPNTGKFAIRGEISLFCSCCALWAENLGKRAAESVSRLLAQYGFMIAPALRDPGKLGLMQIPADAPCTDAEQLADFADYFK